jgi:hypothetical protein
MAVDPSRGILPSRRPELSDPARGAPARTDAKVLTVALVRQLARRPSNRGWLAEVRRDWAGCFPPPPARSEFNRRVR